MTSHHSLWRKWLHGKLLTIPAKPVTLPAPEAISPSSDVMLVPLPGKASIFTSHVVSGSCHSPPWLSLETLASSSLLHPLTSKHHKNNSERTAFPALQVTLLSSAASISLYSQASPKNHLHTLSLFSHLPLTPQLTLLGFHPQKAPERVLCLPCC